MAERRRGLGKGLGALIPPTPSTNDRPTDVFFPRGSTPIEHPEDRFTGNKAATDGVENPTARPTPASDDGFTGNSGTEGAAEHVSQRGAEGLAPVGIGEVDASDLPSSVEVTEGSELGAGLAPVPGATFAELPIDEIVANARQPRQVFDDDDLAELTHSVQEIGVLQPIVVRQSLVEGSGYELIMGERRLRASKAAGLATIPAIIRDTSDDDMLRDALLENLHRSQLNPLEEAAAYQQLLEDFGCTHEELAKRIGRSRPQISNTLRLMKLPALVQRRVASGVLSAGHARALLGLSDGASMERLAQRIVAEGLSVRAVEEIVILGEDAQPAVSRRRSRAVADPRFEQISRSLSDRLDTRVQIAMGQRKGKLTVEFAGQDDLDRILALLAAERTDD
ncbi:ParB/RepB/Spo0J family partition protein [Ornithinimicrobium sp. Arc0846-15]|nr:ParB/RepB/Spo0J family partition protein [Ornithinimicrobium laminariae]